MWPSITCRPTESPFVRTCPGGETGYLVTGLRYGNDMGSRVRRGEELPGLLEPASCRRGPPAAGCPSPGRCRQPVPAPAARLSARLGGQAAHGAEPDVDGGWRPGTNPQSAELLRSLPDVTARAAGLPDRPAHGSLPKRRNTPDLADVLEVYYLCI